VTFCIRTYPAFKGELVWVGEDSGVVVYAVYGHSYLCLDVLFYILAEKEEVKGVKDTALHLRQKSIISSGPASACAPAVGAPYTDSQCLPVSELLIISTLATAKPRAEPEAEAEADSKHFDTNGAFQKEGIE
jgi:hypothetical protein